MLGVLRRYRATPLRPQTLLGARIIVHTLISVLAPAVAAALERQIITLSS